MFCWFIDIELTANNSNTYIFSINLTTVFLHLRILADSLVVQFGVTLHRKVTNKGTFVLDGTK